MTMTHHQFEWDGNHPVLNFVNTLDERFSEQPLERLTNYGALLNFMEQSQLLNSDVVSVMGQYTTTAWAEQTLQAVLKLRESLWMLLDSRENEGHEAQRAIAQIASEIKHAHDARELEQSGYGLRWEWKQGDDVRRPLWELALKIENLLVSEDARLIKQCAAEDCGVFFLDKSRAGTRRWCSMSNCGNRNKVRRFRATNEDEPTPYA